MERKRRKSRARVTVQMDKSTCQTYNRELNEFGYKGVPTRKTKELLNRIESGYSVSITVVVQPTHCYDFNALDALINSVVKKEMR